MREAHEIVSALGMQPHPEGGWYVEIHRSLQRVKVIPRKHDPGLDANAGTGGGAPTARTSRAAMTSIYYLLERGQRSHWHRVDADELWAWHAGAPMELSVAPGREPQAGDSRTSHARDRAAPAVVLHRLGMNLAAGERPQAVVPAHAWQSAQPLGEWSLMGCVVAPGFEFAHFELAPAGWSP